MAPTADEVAKKALGAARRFLSRWSDAYTSNARDDLAQDAVVEAWLRRGSLRRPERFDAFVRTIARRRRWKALRRHLRVGFESLEANRELTERLTADHRAGTRALRVGGRAVPLDVLLCELEVALRQLGSLNGQILRGYYEGFSCAELADRYQLAEDCVKVRLHRSRTRLRRRFVARFEREEP